MGKGAKSTGWFNNFKLPFSSVKVTYQLEHPWQGQASGSIWSIVRGSEGLKQLTIGDIELPSGARLKMVKKDVFLQPLEFVDIVSVPKGQGGVSLRWLVCLLIRDFREFAHSFVRSFPFA